MKTGSYLSDSAADLMNDLGHCSAFCCPGRRCISQSGDDEMSPRVSKEREEQVLIMDMKMAKETVRGRNVGHAPP